MRDDYYSFCHEKELIDGMTLGQLPQYIRVNNHRVGQGDAPLFIYEGLLYAQCKLAKAKGCMTMDRIRRREYEPDEKRL